MTNRNRARDLFMEHLDPDKMHREMQNTIRNIQQDYENNVKKNILALREEINKAMKTGKVYDLFENEHLKEEVEAIKKKGKKKKLPVLAETTNTSGNVTYVKVKEEKISISTSAESDTENKTAKDNFMPAPSFIPPKKKGKAPKIKQEPVSGRCTRSKTKQGLTRESDVIFQKPTIDTVDLSDCGQDTADGQSETRSTRTRSKKTTVSSAIQNERLTRSKIKETVPEEVRSTRTRTIRKDKETEQEVRSTRTRTIRKENENDAAPLEDDKEKDVQKSNGTADNTAQAANGKRSRSLSDRDPEEKDKPLVAPVPPVPPTKEPVATQDPKSGLFNIFSDNLQSDLLTDDDSFELPKTPEKKSPVKAMKTAKEVFSPYEKSSTKKKIEAFEKLQKAKEVPVKAVGSLRKPSPAVKEKAKLFQTPLHQKLHGRVSNKDGNALNGSIKSAQKDPRELYRKQQEREQAAKKKEAMLLQMSETKRKLNEQKQLRAQQQRKALEEEKQKQLELQQLKEQRLKKRELEREEEQRKLKLEQEKKRLIQKQNMEEQRNGKAPPIYMTTQLEPLPTDDCYDSDDPNYKSGYQRLPSWAETRKIKITALTMLTAGEKIQNTLWKRHAQTPDLREIFEDIHPRKLKRNSSAIWKKSPRYTMLTNLNDTTISEQDS